MRRHLSKTDGRNSNHFTPSSTIGLSRSTLLFRRLYTTLQGVAGGKITYDDLAGLTGEPKSTLCNWYNGDGQPSPEALLCMLEMLPVGSRNEILSELPFCRRFPTLQHPHFAHDPIAVSRLQNILACTTGMTFVCGEQDALNTFVITALGHSFRFGQKRGNRVTGLDIHTPDWFVPIPGIMYLDNVTSPHRIRSKLEGLWPEFAESKDRMVVFNGPWTAVPELHTKICALSRLSHVVVGETHPFNGNQSNATFTSNQLPTSARIIVVSAEGNELERIKINIRVP